MLWSMFLSPMVVVVVVVVVVGAHTLRSEGGAVTCEIADGVGPLGIRRQIFARVVFVQEIRDLAAKECRMQLGDRPFSMRVETAG